VEVVLALAVLAALLLPSDILRFGAAPPPEPAQAPAGEVPDDVTGGLFDREFVQWRLMVLADELARIDADPGVMARGFRTTVARSAYEALLADAAALRDHGPGGPAHDGPRELEFELL
jgi:hypothetical protein